MATSNKAIKTDSSTTTKKTRSRAESVCEESHWDRLPLEMQPEQYIANSGNRYVEFWFFVANRKVCVLLVLLRMMNPIHLAPFCDMQPHWRQLSLPFFHFLGSCWNSTCGIFVISNIGHGAEGFWPNVLNYCVWMVWNCIYKLQVLTEIDQVKNYCTEEHFHYWRGTVDFRVKRVRSLKHICFRSMMK